jgi:hypothetical protein
MKKMFLLLFLLSSLVTGNASGGSKKQPPVVIPDFLIGRFRDDYGITYTITQQYFLQEPSWKYHIIKYDSVGMFFIARNDAGNDYEPGKYSRIDIMRFPGATPYTWGYCIVTYDADNAASAETRLKADKSNPKKGCDGFPFSRMKRIGR